VTGDEWWWAQRARQLQFGQLDAVRKQAETWRNGLAGATALVGAVLVVKGKDDFTRLDTPYAVGVPLVLGFALLLLLTATALAVYAAAGEPGDRFTLNGETLRAWTEVEIEDAWRSIARARALTGIGITLIVAATVTAWFAPVKAPETPLVRIHAEDVQVCGKLLQQDGSLLRVGEADRYQIIPLTGLVTVEKVRAC
jgi:hypothetical protein